MLSASSRQFTRRASLGRPDVYLIVGWLLIIVALLGAALMWIFVRPDPAASRKSGAEMVQPEFHNRHVGTIVSPAIEQDICTEYQFNNDTGAFVRRGPIACPDSVH